MCDLACFTSKERVCRVDRTTASELPLNHAHRIPIRALRPASLKDRLKYDKIETVAAVIPARGRGCPEGAESTGFGKPGWVGAKIVSTGGKFLLNFGVAEGILPFGLEDGGEMRCYPFRRPVEDQLQELARTAEATPNDPWAWMNLARALIDGGALFPGRHVLQRAFGVAGDDDRVWLEIGRMFQQLGVPEDAVDAYRQVCKLNPGVGGGEVSLSRLFLEDSEAEAAEMEARNGLRHIPDNLELHAALARALYHQERYEAAVEHAEIALRRPELDPDLLRVTARIYDRLNAPEQRLDALERLYALQPTDAEVAIELGLAALAAKQLDRAKKALDDAYTSGPFPVETALALATGLRRIGRLNEALIILAGAQQQAPASGIVALERALVLEQLERHSDALPEFARALSASPPPPRCSFYFGRALARAGRLEESATHLLRAASDDSSDEAVRRILADVLQKLDGGASNVPTAKNLDVDIRIFSLPELIEFLAQQRATGILDLVTADGVVTIAMADGALACVRPIDAPSLYELFESKGLSTEKFQSIGVTPETPSLELVERLSKSDLLPAAVLEGALTRFVVRGLMKVLPIKAGRATFVGATETIAIEPSVLVSARGAMFDAMRRIDERRVGRSDSSNGRDYSTS